ncbi:MAG: hypothetical protein FJX80_00590 [Bacteroidetes bacterium]|nr:hypothetical protein [Bacteroidota bacterium]
MKKIFLYIFLLFSVSLLHAQKSSRATEALLDGKYDKAADLYQNVLDKDSINVVAHVGLAITRIKQYSAVKKIQPLSDYIFCFQNLKKARYLYSYVNKDDKKILNEKLSFLSASQTEDLHQSISSILWDEFFSKNNDIDSVQLYFDKYCAGSIVKEEALKRLAKLRFDKIQYSNAVKDFEDFVDRFKVYPESSKALEAIQRLEIAEALLGKSVQLLERALERYPFSSRKLELKNRLANVYFSSIDSSSEDVNISKVIDQLGMLQIDLADQYIDTCQYFLFKNGYKQLVNSNDKQSVRDFLSRYSRFNAANEFRELQQRKLDLLFSSLTAASTVSYSELHEFITEAPVEYEGLPHLLDIVIRDINFHALSKLESNIRHFVTDSISLLAEYRGTLYKLVRSQFIENYFIDTALVYEAIKTLNYNLSEDQYISGIINNLRLVDQVTTKSISIKLIPSNIAGLVTLRLKLSSDSINKQQYFLNNSDETYILFPDFKTSLPIYAGISRKYEITSFTKPEIVGYLNGKLDVQVFGFKSYDAQCCPSSKFIIAYEDSSNTFNPKSLTSLTAIQGNIHEMEEAEYRHLKLTLVK